MQLPRDTTRMPKPDELRAARGRRRAEILVLMRGLARRYKNLVTRIGKAEMNATFIEYELFQLIKSMKEIGEFLTKQTGKPVTKRAITQNVYRLRKELFERGGVNPYLIQTNRRRGLRFALRRKAGPLIGTDL